MSMDDPTATLPPPSASAPAVRSAQVMRFLAQLDTRLTVMESQRRPEQLTPLQVETALHYALTTQGQAVFARARLEIRASFPRIGDLEELLARFDQLTK